MNNPNEAEELLIRALNVTEKALGPDHPEVADIHVHLGYVLIAIGHYQGAEQHFRQALSIQETVFGPDSENLLDTLTSLGVSLARQNRTSEAQAIALRVHKLEAGGSSQAPPGQDKTQD